MDPLTHSPTDASRDGPPLRANASSPNDHPVSNPVTMMSSSITQFPMYRSDRYCSAVSAAHSQW